MPGLPCDSGKRSRRFGTLCSLGVLRTIAFPADGDLGGRTCLRVIARVRSALPLVAAALNLHRPKELERKDRPEFGSVILPFVGFLSSDCV
jgi:hypothetical protein